MKDETGMMNGGKGGPGPTPIAPPVAVQKCYDLALDLMQRIEKFPWSQKFTLGDRLAAAVLDMLEDLVAVAVHDCPGEWFGRRLLT